MASRVYPARDPFPQQASRNLEVRRADSPSPRVTIPTPSVLHIAQLAEVYLDRFGSEIGPARGQFVLMRGAHGGGKTHAIGYIREQVDVWYADPDRPTPHVRDTLQLYIKIESPDFVGVYRNLMRGVAPDRLLEIAKRFLAVVVAETAGADADNDEMREAIDRWLAEDPDRVTQLFDRYFVDPGAALERQADEVAGVTGETDDFRHAFSYLLKPELSDAAAAWLRGEDPGELAMRRLGVSGPIASPEMARRGLQLLATLCGRAGTALFIYLDQYEKLVVGEPELVAGNAGLLAGLAEAIPPADAMIVLSGNLEAWEQAPEDLPQRFAYNLVECRGFEFDAAASLLYIWLHPGEDATIAERDDDALYPLTVDAVRVMHLETGGNPRLLLQLASQSFRRAQPVGRLVDGNLVRAVRREAGQVPVEPQRVVADVRRFAEAEGFSVHSVGNGHASLRLAYGGADRLLMMLGQATHYYDEVLDAAGQLDAIEELRRTAPGARALLVVLGYDSPSVRDALGKAGIDSLVYRPENFAQDLRPILVQARDVAAKSVDFSDQLSELRATLEDLRREREVDVRGVAAGADQLAAEAGARDARGRWDDALRSWATERRRIADRITDVRKGRRDDDLADLERLRARAEAQRRGRFVTAYATVIVTAALLTVSLTVTPTSSTTDEWLRAALILGYGGGVVIVAAAAVIFARSGHWGLRDTLWRGRALSDLADPVASLGDLQRLARAFVDRMPSLRFLLLHANPQVRFAASLLPDTPGALVRAMPSERSAIVRRAFARQLGRERKLGEAALEHAAEPWTPEALYIYERLLLGGGHAELQARVARLLARLLPTGESGSAAARVLEREGLDKAFRTGLPFESRAVLAAVPLEDVRRAIRDLSPFDDGGLGTYDALVTIELVDRAYLELSQIVFLSELGLLVDVRR